MRILVVDDNEALTFTFSIMLELMGHEVHIAKTGTEAIHMGRAVLPDAVLLDLGLPDMTGFDACRELRGFPELARTLFIAQTGYSSQGVMIQAKEVGFQHFLVKPVTYEQLAEYLPAVA